MFWNRRGTDSLGTFDDSDTYARRAQFDHELFASCVKKQRNGRSLRDIEALVVISADRLSRIERGAHPSIFTFARLCEWMEVNPCIFFYVSEEE